MDGNTPPTPHPTARCPRRPPTPAPRCGAWSPPGHVNTLPLQKQTNPYILVKRFPQNKTRGCISQGCKSIGYKAHEKKNRHVSERTENKNKTRLLVRQKSRARDGRQVLENGQCCHGPPRAATSRGRLSQEALVRTGGDSRADRLTAPHDASPRASCRGKHDGHATSRARTARRRGRRRRGAKERRVPASRHSVTGPRRPKQRMFRTRKAAKNPGRGTRWRELRGPVGLRWPRKW